MADNPAVAVNLGFSKHDFECMHCKKMLPKELYTCNGDLSFEAYCDDCDLSWGDVYDAED